MKNIGDQYLIARFCITKNKVRQKFVTLHLQLYRSAIPAKGMPE
jgi:hypothetical protein